MAEPIHGWGRYPRTDAAVIGARDADQVRAAIAAGPILARGLGRSYGDSANASRVLSTRWLDRMIDFDPARGLLRCEAGVSLAQILDVFVPRGWFLPVTPGTRFVTVGGAIAADVHGKNHHRAGTFGTHVESIALLGGDGELIDCAPHRNRDLFLATCGGMGLTGVIVAAELRLIPIRASGIEQTTLRARSLGETFALIDEHGAATYSVAWVDTLASGRQLGRSLLMLGEHAAAGHLDPPAGDQLPVPSFVPGALLTATSVRAFNAFYYHRPIGPRRVELETFFYPLDRLADWNRLYGPQGFLQYHFVVPKATGAAALHEVLRRVAATGRGSFLAVLKLCGAANDSPLSFPLAGYSLALDLRADAGAFALLDELDPIVLHHGGRIYLTKDARMSEATFKTGYPRWAEFEQVRARCGAHGRFASNQSRRLGLQ